MLKADVRSQPKACIHKSLSIVADVQAATVSTLMHKRIWIFLVGLVFQGIQQT